MTPPSLPIYESATTQFLAADFWIGSDTIFGCRILNRQRHSRLPISESVAPQFGWRFLNRQWKSFGCRFLNQQGHSFQQSISESVTTQFWAAEFWIGHSIVGCWFLNRQWKSLGCWFLNRQQHSFWQPIFELAARQFYCQFLNQQRKSFGYQCLNRQRHSGLSISESAVTQFFVVDFWIGRGTVGCWFLNQQRRSFLLSISESAATV